MLKEKRNDDSEREQKDGTLARISTQRNLNENITKENYMPNWCKNNLRIISNGEKVLDLLEMVKNDEGEFTFTKFMPTPKELDDTQSPTPDTMSEEEKNRLMDTYGATDWYTWRCKNWGCKWDAQESAFYKDGDDWIITFQTPWGPPIEFLTEFSKKFSNITFQLQFADEGYGQYPLGEATIINGSVMYDGPEQDDARAETFAESVWDEEWVDDWTQLEGKEDDNDTEA